MSPKPSILVLHRSLDVRRTFEKQIADRLTVYHAANSTELGDVRTAHPEIKVIGIGSVKPGGERDQELMELIAELRREGYYLVGCSSNPQICGWMQEAGCQEVTDWPLQWHKLILEAVANTASA